MVEETESADVIETKLPGVGVRHEFETSGGERVAVVVLRSGRREFFLYDRDDPDACRGVVHLSRPDARTLSEMLGSSQIAESVADVQHIEGLALEWVTVPTTSPYAGVTIGDGGFRTRTGVSIIAVVRGDTTFPAPGPEAVLEANDVAVVTGTPEGLADFRALVTG